VSLPIQDQKGSIIGSVQIKRSEQAADVSYRFCKQHKLPGWFYKVSLTVVGLLLLTCVYCRPSCDSCVEIPVAV
jgi:hypothetical protein